MSALHGEYTERRKIFNIILIFSLIYEYNIEYFRVKPVYFGGISILYSCGYAT